MSKNHTKYKKQTSNFFEKCEIQNISDVRTYDKLAHKISASFKYIKFSKLNCTIS